jgi:hypothetical protein
MGNAKNIPEKGKLLLPYQAAWVTDPARLKIAEKSRQIGWTWATAYGLVRRKSLKTARLDAWISSRDDIQARLFLEDCKAFAAILQAGASLGWQMNDAEPRLIVGTLNVRDHMVQVDVPYDRRTYSILYRDSANMNYDGGNIHSNYTGWVQRLNAAINSRLSML